MTDNDIRFGKDQDGVCAVCGIKGTRALVDGKTLCAKHEPPVVAVVRQNTVLQQMAMLMESMDLTVAEGISSLLLLVHALAEEGVSKDELHAALDAAATRWLDMLALSRSQPIAAPAPPAAVDASVADTEPPTAADDDSSPVCEGAPWP
jgi:hypothetical protein